MATRVNKLNKTKKEAYLAKLREGMRRGMAAEAIGITRVTIWNAMQKDGLFAQAVDQAELDACEIIEDALFNKAKSGNTTAIQVWLYNRHPERWKDQRNLNKTDALELFLATLPTDLARALRPYLAGQKPGSSQEAPGNESGQGLSE